MDSTFNLIRHIIKNRHVRNFRKQTHNRHNRWYHTSRDHRRLPSYTHRINRSSLSKGVTLPRPTRILRSFTLTRPQRGDLLKRHVKTLRTRPRPIVRRQAFTRTRHRTFLGVKPRTIMVDTDKSAPVPDILLRRAALRSFLLTGARIFLSNRETCNRP